MPPDIFTLPGLIDAGILATTLGFLLVAFVTGRLRTDREVRELREDRNARLADKDQQIAQWREAYQLSEQAREAQRDLLTEAAEGSRTAIALLESLRAAAYRGSGNGNGWDRDGLRAFPGED